MRRLALMALVGICAAFLTACAGHLDYHDQATMDTPTDKNAPPPIPNQ